jgi:hypothetical protein
LRMPSRSRNAVGPLRHADSFPLPGPKSRVARCPESSRRGRPEQLAHRCELRKGIGLDRGRQTRVGDAARARPHQSRSGFGAARVISPRRVPLPPTRMRTWRTGSGPTIDCPRRSHDHATPSHGRLNHAQKIMCPAAWFHFGAIPVIRGAEQPKARPDSSPGRGFGCQECFSA